MSEATATGLLAPLGDHPVAWVRTALAALVLMLVGFLRTLSSGLDATSIALWFVAVARGVLVVPLWGVSLSGDGAAGSAPRP